MTPADALNQLFHVSRELAAPAKVHEACMQAYQTLVPIIKAHEHSRNTPKDPGSARQRPSPGEAGLESGADEDRAPRNGTRPSPDEVTVGA